MAGIQKLIDFVINRSPEPSSELDIESTRFDEIAEAWGTLVQPKEKTVRKSTKKPVKKSAKKSVKKTKKESKR